MRALTVQQPWAWAIVAGWKDVENRTQLWSYRGPLAIHAGARDSDRGHESPLVIQATFDASFFGDDPATYEARSAVIGVTDLVDAHHAMPECCASDWAGTSYVEHGGRERRQIVHLVLENARAFRTPIPAKGRLGLWTPDPDLLAEINNQLQETR